jgi:hypothetical protein
LKSLMTNLPPPVLLPKRLHFKPKIPLSRASQFRNDINDTLVVKVNLVMLGDSFKRANLFGRIWQYVKRQIVDVVPEDLAMCQFDCRKGQCTQDEWEACERRIRKGAGEFFPDSPHLVSDFARPAGAEKHTRKAVTQIAAV